MLYKHTAVLFPFYSLVHVSVELLSTQNDYSVFVMTEVVMTPSKKGKTTTIRIEKVKKSNLDETQVAHMAGGQHSGLVINKQITGTDC